MWGSLLLTVGALIVGFVSGVIWCRFASSMDEWEELERQMAESEDAL